MKKNNLVKKNIVIVGGGFAGVRAALDLNNYLHDSDEYEIILVDHKDYQTYQAGLYEAATTEHRLVEAKKVKRTVTIPFSDIFGKTKVKVFKGFVDRIDTAGSKVITDSRIIPFDYLVCALGSISDFYGITNLEKFGFTLKSLEDAIMIRNRVEDLVVKKDHAQFIVGGGGFSGTEFAGELHNLLKHECMYHGKDLDKFKILVVEGGPGLLSGLSEKVSSIVSARISQMGIETRFSALITELGKDFVTLNMKERLECDLLIWTGGVRSCRLPVDYIQETDKKDRTLTTPSLNLQNYSNIFIAGDNLCFSDPVSKKLMPQTAQEAINQAKFVAKNIYRMIRGKSLVPYQPGSTRYVIPVTGKFAVMYSPNLIVSGFWGWVIRKGADLRYFLSVLPWSKALSYWLFENKIFMKND
ncbi:MAG: NAD(P)/FAD-dependent oxidoreductase [Candidatus Doudnabacteria bacterium]